MNRESDRQFLAPNLLQMKVFEWHRKRQIVSIRLQKRSKNNQIIKPRLIRFIGYSSAAIHRDKQDTTSTWAALSESTITVGLSIEVVFEVLSSSVLEVEEVVSVIWLEDFVSTAVNNERVVIYLHWYLNCWQKFHSQKFHSQNFHCLKDRCWLEELWWRHCYLCSMLVRLSQSICSPVLLLEVVVESGPVIKLKQWRE